jgi:hypothetical protein
MKYKYEKYYAIFFSEEKGWYGVLMIEEKHNEPGLFENLIPVTTGFGTRLECEMYLHDYVEIELNLFKRGI